MPAIKRLGCVAATLIASALAGCAFSATEETVHFDTGEKEKGAFDYKERTEDKSKKKKTDSKLVKAIQTHIKNLKDPDPDIRQSSAEMLGILHASAALAVPDLIDCLKPERKERELMLIAAYGALVKITSQNFGYKAYDEWQKWWLKNKEDFMKKAESGVDETSKLAAVTANTVGLEQMHRGEYRAAQVQFLDAINRDPEVPDYRNNLGLALIEQGRYLDAMQYFEETIGLNPDLPQPYMNIGRCYSRMEKSIEAQAWFKKALDRDKEGRLWDNFWMVGKEYMKRGEWRLAYEYLDQARVKAEKRRTYDPRLYKDLAITHYGLDEYHSAWKELMNIEQLGYDADPGFKAKVKKALIDMGVDPDAEDKEARARLAGRPNDETEAAPEPNPKK